MRDNYALDFVQVTEIAAVAAARLVGRGDKIAADDAATTAMRSVINTIDFDGTVVIGEGELDEAPMLYIGEKVGTGRGPKLDIAVDPLEGTKLCATGGPNSITTIAVAEHGKFLHAPDMYMDKIAVGPAGRGIVDIRKTPTENLKALAKAKGEKVEELTAVMLDRDRHKELIAEVRAAGARVVLVSDGDVSTAFACAEPESGIDILFGIGGAPEGVLAAAALRCLGGDFQGRLVPENDEERKRLRDMGADEKKVYSLEELAGGPIIFSATAVTNGSVLKGVDFFAGGAHTESVVMNSETGTVRRVRTTHHFDARRGEAYYALCVPDVSA